MYKFFSYAILMGFKALSSKKAKDKNPIDFKANFYSLVKQDVLTVYLHDIALLY